MSNKCDVNTGRCEETAQNQGGCDASCGCGCQESSSCCPIEKATALWKSSFCQALKEVKVEILKEKIKKAWGAKLDKSADAVLEAAEAQWNAALTKGKADLDLKEKIARIVTEGKK